MQIEVHLVNAFVDGDTGGNPAGVVLGADALTMSQKLSIARKVNLSETAFVSASAVASLKVEFFTPTRQIPHCGHATIAAFSLCRSAGILTEGLHSKESIDGTLEIELRDGKAFMFQQEPSYTELKADAPLYSQALAAIGITSAQLLPGTAPCVARSGNAFLLVPVLDASVLEALVPVYSEIERICAELDLIGFYPFVLRTNRANRSAGARMFAPRFGIPEESATGTAAGPLACYLADYLGNRSVDIFVEQGWYMIPPSPSLIEISFVKDVNERRKVKVGGYAETVGSLRVEV